MLQKNFTIEVDTLGEIPKHLPKRLLADRHRPTVKAMIVSGKRCCHNHVMPTWLGKTRNARDLLLNFPGGGVYTSESFRDGLMRELKEELPDFRVTKQQLTNAPILAYGVVPTSRSNFSDKFVIVVGILVGNSQLTEQHLKPNIAELRKLAIGNIAAAALRLGEAKGTRPEMAELYQQSFTKLRRLLSP